ncbi:MAG: periplasmic heavy metal sensor [Albidovulum sp.]
MADKPDRKRGAARWKTVVLILSLALNIFILGSMAGRMIAGHGSHGGWRAPEVGFGPFTEVLSHKDRRALREAFYQSAPDFRNRRKEAEADFHALASALRADTLDPSAVEQVLAAQTIRTTARLDLGRTLLTKQLLAMSLEERKALAERIETALRRH